MHSPTLITFGAMLMALVSGVLWAVWRFNKHIPGLQLWAVSFSMGFVSIMGLLLRERLPEVLAGLLIQSTMLAGAFLYWWGCSVHTARRLLPMRHLAEIDPLTNIFNRRAFFTLLNKALHQAQRSGAGLAVLVVDLDHFKKSTTAAGTRAATKCCATLFTWPPSACASKT